MSQITSRCAKATKRLEKQDIVDTRKTALRKFLPIFGVLALIYGCGSLLAGNLGAIAAAAIAIVGFSFIIFRNKSEILVWSLFFAILLYSLGTLKLSLRDAMLGAVVFGALIGFANANYQQRWSVIFFGGSLTVAFPTRILFGLDIVGIAVLASLAWMLIEKSNSLRHRNMGERSNFFTPLMSLMLGAFAGAAILSSTDSFISYMPWLIGISLVTAMLALPRQNLPRVHTVRRTLLMSGAFTMLYDLVGMLRGSGFTESAVNAGRFSGSLGDYELAAEYYGLIILLAVGSLLVDRTPRWVFISILNIIAGTVLLFTTLARGPLILLCLTIPVLLLLTALSDSRSRKRAALTSSVILLAVIGFWNAITSSDVFGRLSDVDTSGRISDAINRGPLWDRFTNLDSFKQVGFLGNGFDYPYMEIGTYPHSLYLWTYWSGGLVALLSLAAIFATLFVMLLIAVIRGSRDAVWALMLLAYLLADQVKIEFVRFPETIVLFWTVIAGLVVISRREDVHEEES